MHHKISEGLAVSRDNSAEVTASAHALADADAVVVGAGAGLSAAAGFTYGGERFERLFGDFKAKYGYADMYSAGFYPYGTLEEHWAYWSRYIWCNRYEPAPKGTYAKLLRKLPRPHGAQRLRIRRVLLHQHGRLQLPAK